MFYQSDNGLLVSLLSTNKGLSAICPASHVQCSAQLFVPGLLCWLSKFDLEILNIIFFLISEYSEQPGKFFRCILLRIKVFILVICFNVPYISIAI